MNTLHEVRDTAKLDSLATAMEENGWQGRPILALDCGDYLQAITGSHRIAAAELAGIEPDVYTIEQPPYKGDDEQADLFTALIEGDDDTRYTALVELVERGDVEKKSLEIFEEEL